MVTSAPEGYDFLTEINLTGTTAEQRRAAALYVAGHNESADVGMLLDALGLRDTQPNKENN